MRVRRRAPRRPVSRSRHGPFAAARRSTAWRGSASSRSASRPPPSTAETSAERRRMDVADHADLVIVGAGTIGGWASVFARPTGSAGSSSSSAGWSGWAPRPARRASSGRRAARRRRSPSAAGRSTSTAASRPPTAPIPGFRELGYLILAVTEDDERAGRERVAMQQAHGLPVRWLDAGRGRGHGAITLSSQRPPRRQLHRRPTARSTRRATSAPTRSRCRRAGVELRERTAFRGLRTTPTPDGGQPRHRRRDRPRARSRPSGSS